MHWLEHLAIRKNNFGDNYIPKSFSCHTLFFVGYITSSRNIALLGQSSEPNNSSHIISALHLQMHSSSASACSGESSINNNHGERRTLDDIRSHHQRAQAPPEQAGTEEPQEEAAKVWRRQRQSTKRRRTCGRIGVVPSHRLELRSSREVRAESRGVHGGLRPRTSREEGKRRGDRPCRAGPIIVIIIDRKGRTESRGGNR